MDNPKKHIIDGLAYYVEHQYVSESKAKTTALLPLVEFGECNANSVENEWTRYLKDNYNNDDFFVRDEWPLLEASYWSPSFGLYVFRLKEDAMENGAYSVNFEFYVITDKVPAKSSSVIVGTKKSEGVVLVGSVMVNPGAVKRFHFREMKTLLANGKVVNNNTLTTPSTTVEAYEAIIKAGITTLKNFMDFQNGLDMYPVSVLRKTPKRLINGSNRVSKRLEIVHVNAPKIVFLNVLPEVQVSGTNAISDGPTMPRKMHQRAGYWKTLTHERYARHPKFGIEKAIRVKPAWIGSVVSEYEGNVYRVLLPSTVAEMETVQ